MVPRVWTWTRLMHFLIFYFISHYYWLSSISHPIPTVAHFIHNFLSKTFKLSSQILQKCLDFQDQIFGSSFLCWLGYAFSVSLFALLKYSNTRNWAKPSNASISFCLTLERTDSDSARNSFWMWMSVHFFWLLLVFLNLEGGFLRIRDVWFYSGWFWSLCRRINTPCGVVWAWQSWFWAAWGPLQTSEYLNGVNLI